MADTDPLWLDLDTFWDVAFEFEDWDYTFSNTEHAHPFIKGALEGYPDWLLLKGDELSKGRPEPLRVSKKGGLAAKVFSDDTAKDPASRGRRFTNCCMFVESAIIGTAYRMPALAARLAWGRESHDSAMYNGPPPPKGYSAGRLAELLEPLPAELEPNTIYVAQTKGHTFFLIDYDPASKKVLSLEANHSPYFANPKGADWWGGVGYGGVGRVLRRPPKREDWVASSGTRVWTKLRGELVALARLNVRESGYAPSVCLPFDAPADFGPPARHYDLAETKVQGGFYPVGTQRNLHGGVHLPLPGDAPAPVHALADGDVVAARLGSAGKGHAGALDAAGDHAAFVLLRHQVEVAAVAEGGAPEALSLLGLHLHLVPPGARPDLWEGVPWLQRLKRQAKGAIVEVDPDSETFRRRSWPQAARSGATELFTGPVHEAAAADDGKAVAFPTDTPPGRVGAAWRAAEADVAEAVAALTTGDGEVATFARPLLPVAKGELLGWVAPIPLESRAEPAEHGFLHWELLAPVASGTSALKRFVALAEAHLGLEGHFKQVAEGSANNQLDGGEAAALAGALPAPAPTGDWPAQVAALMTRGSAAHPFALPIEGERRTTLDYPVRLEVETLKHLGEATLAARTLQVTLETDAGPVTATVEVGGDTKSVVVHLPAAARKITAVRAEGVSFDPGARSKAGEEALHRLEVEHLKRLTGVRWRNVLLRHLNEWSVAGLTRSLEPRRAELGKDGLRALVEAVAWWDHAERPIVGAAGKEERLFGGVLPKQAELLDALHPVTGAWLLDLLVGRGKARVLPPNGAGHDVRVALQGWLPAESTARAVGDPVWAVKVAAGDVTGGSATFEATQGSRRVALGADAWRDGSAAVVIAAPLWGSWTLAGDGAPLGSATCTAAAPGPLAGATLAAPKKGGPLTWTLDFERDRPAALLGWALVRTRAPGGDWGPAEAVGLPLRLTPPPPAAAGDLVVDGGFYVSGKGSAKVSANFTYGELSKAAPGAPATARVAVRLVEVLQGVRARTTSLTPGGLTADGLSLRVTGSAGQAKLLEAAEAARAAADAAASASTTSSPFAGATFAPDGAGVRLTVPAPPPPAGGPGGPLAGALDPTPALQTLLVGRQLGAGASLEVGLGCLFVNGGAPPPDKATDDGWEAAAKGLAAADKVEAWWPEPIATLVQPGVGPTTWRYEGSNLLLRAELLGRDAAFWAKARPTFVVDGADVTSRVDKVALTASLPVAAGDLAGRALSVSARVAGEPPADVLVATSPATTLDTTPAIVDARLVEEPPGTLLLTARLQAWPLERELEVRLLDAQGAPVVLPRGTLTHGRTSKAGLGLPATDGTLRATLKAAAVQKALGGGEGAACLVELRRPEGSSGVLGKGTPSPREVVGYRFPVHAPELPAGGAP